ncbi:MAG: hypothetical protein JWM57_627 [Phycisphaerales bacterium]|nr:hypothetical protein [Phycisphaerales bacterium]
MKTRSILAATAAMCVAVPSVRANPVYGGPSYDATTSTGFLDPQLPTPPGLSAGNGAAVGNATKYTNGTSVGQRAVRWNNSSAVAVELGNLGTVSGSTTSVAYAINSNGIAVGYARKSSAGTNLGERAVRWDAGGTAATELGNLGTNYGGYTSGAANALNAAGMAFGYMSKYDPAAAYIGYRAVRWGAGGTAATELGNLGTDSFGLTSSIVYAANNDGTAVGIAQKYVAGSGRGFRAVRWDAGGTVATELGNLGTNASGVASNYAYSVNSAGAAVGHAEKYAADGEYVGTRAVRWDAGGTAATELDSLGTDGSGFTGNDAYAINAAGTAVGIATKYVAGTSVGQRAVRWNAGGTAATELGNLGTAAGGKTTSVAYAINAGGTTVGYANKYTAGTLVGARAVAWGADSVAFDLNALLSPADAACWTFNEARGISDTNWITGLGNYDPDGSAGPLAAYKRTFLIKIGFGGDADLNDKVDFNDFLVLQNNFNRTGTTFSEGDFNYDSVTDFNDFLILQNSFGTGLAGAGAVAVTSQEIAAMQAFALTAAVPEPGSLAIGISVVSLGVARPRRRRSQAR